MARIINANDEVRDKGSDGEGRANNREFICRARDEFNKERRYGNR
ncbi:MAG: hypothetical protein BME93_03180 [Methanosarcinales archaeon Met12]|nr:MAG: hypothetical protein BME93_03180 [Methanosarcinales archaeon Met12]